LTWRVFAVLIAVPALGLAWLGLRASRVERLEAEEQLRGQQTQLAKLADAAVLTALSPIEAELSRLSPGRAFPRDLPPEVPIVSFHQSGLITFARDRLYFGPFGRHPPERERLTAWPPAVARLVDQAQTAEAQGHATDTLTLLETIRRLEPRLRPWADVVRARVQVRRGERSALAELARAEWSHSPGVTPSGLPVALLACAAGEALAPRERRAFLPLLERSLAGMREGRWWLGADERRFYHRHVGALLQDAGEPAPPPDDRMAELAAIERTIRLSPPSRRSAPTRSLEREASPYLLIWVPAESDAETWNGLAVRQDRAAVVVGPPLDHLFADRPFAGAVRDGTGALVWASGPHAGGWWHAEPLSAIPGWELAFTGPADGGSVGTRQRMWYGFVALMLLVLLTALAMTTHTVRREMELARMKSDFLAAVTHEFKSPITSIKLLLERLGGGRAVGADTAATYRDAIGQETDRLERLVNRVLEAQQIDAGMRQYLRRPESLEQIAVEVVQHLQPAANAKRMTIDLDVGGSIPAVAIDRASIADAIENLVDNAVKYSPAATRIVVRVRMEGRDVCVDVDDQGMGIDHDELPRLFDKFYRGRRGDRQDVRGTGLGLALAKAAVEAHGGRIDVASEPGIGSRFSLRLPA
jgi:signal transduction histidine kinase